MVRRQLVIWRRGRGEYSDILIEKHVSRCLTRNHGAIPQTVTRSPRIQSHTASASRLDTVLIIVIVIVIVIVIAIVINWVIVTQLQQMNYMQLLKLLFFSSAKRSG